MKNLYQLFFNKWKWISLFLFSYLILTSSSSGQENIIRIERILTTKNGNTSPLSIGQEISNYTLVQVSEINSILKEHPKTVDLQLGDIMPDNFSLTESVLLEYCNIISPNAKLVTGSNDGEKIINAQFATYKGKISEDTWITLTISENGIIGRINGDTKSYAIQPLVNTTIKDRSKHIIYEVSNLLAGDGWCGVDDENLSPQLKEFMEKLNDVQLKSAREQLTIEIAVETDYETYVSFDNDSLLTTAFLISTIANVSQYFEKEVDIKLEVVFSRVWTNPNDPYTVKGFFLFNEFEEYWNTNMHEVERDIALLIIRDPARLGGGLAILDGMRKKETSYAISGSQAILTIVHELGHVIGSPHTHNCAWPAGPNGGLEPIDQCASVEGDCGTGEIINQEGTIMSYCSPRNDVFHPLVRKLIKLRTELNPYVGNGSDLGSSINGFVMSDGSGLADVNIIAIIQNYDYWEGDVVSTVSNTDGLYTMTLLNKNYILSAEKDGYLINPVGRNSHDVIVLGGFENINGLNFEAIKLYEDYFEMDNTFQQANLISVGDTIQNHTIHQANDIDYLKFNADSGQTYLIVLHKERNDTYKNISLFEPDGTTQISTSYSNIEWTAEINGTYYIKISGGNGFYGMSISIPLSTVETDLIPLEQAATDWGDYDGDGDLDLICVGMDNNSNHTIKVFRNDDGNLFKADVGIEELPVNYVHQSSVEWGDFDNDGDLDVLIGADNNAIIYINDEGNFLSKRSLDDDLRYVGAATFGDFDNDGDLDVLVQSHNYINKLHAFPVLRIYRNDIYRFKNINIDIQGVDFGKAKWIDYDGDGDLDIMVAGTSCRSGDACSSSINPLTRIYKNENGNFYDANVILDPVTFYPDFSFSDFDNDGDLDFALTGLGNDGTNLITRIYRNDDLVYTLTDTNLTGTHNASMAWGDYDNDGDLDLMISGHERIDLDVSALSKLYINQGDSFRESYLNTILPNITAGSVNWCDYDNDNDLDLFFIGESQDMKGHVHLLRNETPFKNTLPSSPSNLESFVNSGNVTLSWSQSYDDNTPSKGLSYNIRIGSFPGGCDILAPMSDLVTGKRQVARMGNCGLLTQKTLHKLTPKTYYWSVQAIDNSFDGSVWSPEQSFIIPLNTESREYKIQNDRFNLSIIPNPNNGEFRLRFENAKAGYYKVNIINKLGQVQLAKEVYLTGNVNEEEFDLSYLPQGNYFIKVFNEYESKIEKIILN